MMTAKQSLSGCIILAICALVRPVVAGESAREGSVEAGGKYYTLTDGQPDTAGVYTRGILDVGNADTWSGEIVHLDRFNDTGTFFSIGDTHTFNALYYGNVTVGSSSGGFFWPRVRVDASLSRKWLARQNLVTTIGFGYYDAKDIHSDKSVLLETTYYFNAPWIAQAGVRINDSEPGAVVSTSGYMALTYGHDRRRFVTLRGGFGNQGYQPFGAQSFTVDTEFHQLTLTWREWVGHDWGVNFVADDYNSSTYDQRGIELGLFKEF